MHRAGAGEGRTAVGGAGYRAPEVDVGPEAVVGEGEGEEDGEVFVLVGGVGAPALALQVFLVMFDLRSFRLAGDV